MQCQFGQEGVCFTYRLSGQRFSGLQRRLPPVGHNPGQGLRAHVHPGQNHILAAFSGSGGVFIITYADSLGVIASDAIIYNGHEALRSGAALERAAAASAALFTSEA